MVKREYGETELLKYSERDKNCVTLENKEILLHFDSFCLGDTICFSSFIDSFIEYHKPKKVIISTFFPHLFKSTSDKYEFIKANDPQFIEVDKLINVGYDKDDLNHTLNGMMYATKDTMLLPQKIKPGKCPVIPYEIDRNKPNIHKKISIAPESLKKIARWDYDGGWQEIVNRLTSLGFTVSNVSYENTLNLKNVSNYNGFDDIKVSLFEILNSRVFIGLSSGLAWLAWAYGIPVVMISNFTKKQNEFDCFRVDTRNTCNGCFNIFKNIKNNCPIFLNTNRENECHLKITPDMVWEQIELALSFTKK
jgi:autotransporter strand-loop-strand O-heptosyltransferase